MTVKKVLSLVNNERKQANILSSKACDWRDAGCSGLLTHDYCYTKDYGAACTFAYDECGLDFGSAGCSFGTNDICYNTDH